MAYISFICSHPEQLTVKRYVEKLKDLIYFKRNLKVDFKKLESQNDICNIVADITVIRNMGKPI